MPWTVLSVILGCTGMLSPGEARMLDQLTPTQWGTLIGLFALGAVVIGGFAMLGEVFLERRRERVHVEEVLPSNQRVR